MEKVKILNLCFIPDEQVNTLLSNSIDPSLFELVGRPRDRKLSEEEACEHVKDASIILVDPSGPQLPRKVLEEAKNLKFIQFASVGYDQIDLAAATNLGIPVANNPGWAATAVAELTILHILTLLRYTEVQMTDLNRFRTSRELKGKTLGIIGLGSIGQAVAEVAKGFGSKVVYYKRNRLPLIEERQLDIEYLSFHELLSASDIVTVHTPLTSETRNMIGERELSLMKDGSFLVNTARKEIVDEGAVLGALNSGKLAGFGCDFELDASFSGDENVFVTGHIGSSTIEASVRVRRQYIANLCRVIRGEKPLYLVN